VGLDAGATDYVTKPFSMNVLLARLRAHLRPLDQASAEAPIELGRLVVHPDAYRVEVDGDPVTIRPREFELLLALAVEAGKVISRERLLAEVWDLHWESSTKTLDMHVLGLRRKLGDAIDIAAVRGVGYRLDVR
jgi:DNA-binding response OmpR family regulator